ncbi:MAG: diacylglycerol kinase [Mariprofundales bacterium]|nr:diacylglycerol kinase [Mariprofundales bacterium]
MHESPHKGKSGLRRIWYAFQYSLAGLQAAFVCEHAFRQEIMLAALLLPVAIYVDVKPSERALLIFSVLLVLIVELLNSAVEATVDRISLDNHRLAKRAKDIGSAAVLITLVNLVAVWACILSFRSN